MSNTCPNSLVAVIPVAKHTRRHIATWQGRRGCSARPQTSAGAARPRKPRHALPKRGGVFSVSTFLRQAWAQGRRRGAMVHWPDAHAGRGVMPGAQGAERDGAEHRASAPPWAVLQCCESPWRRRLGWG